MEICFSVNNKNTIQKENYKVKKFIIREKLINPENTMVFIWRHINFNTVFLVINYPYMTIIICLAYKMTILEFDKNINYQILNIFA